MIAACGLDCSACPILKAANDGQYAEQLAADWRNSGHPKAVAGWFRCQGCHGDDSLVWSDDCAIRNCCLKDHALENCSCCPDFPCDLLKSFESDGAAHHRAGVENLRRLRMQRLS